MIMKIKKRSVCFRAGMALLVTLAWMIGTGFNGVMPAAAQDELSDARADEQAADMLRRGRRLLESGEIERGENLIGAVPLNFPRSAVRFEAFLALGRHYLEEHDYSLAVRNLSRATESEDINVLEEAHFRLGAAWYGMGDYGRAFSALRRVIEDYPWSEYANDAYYYIGMSHFRLSNWSRAVEAFRMVGTTVPPNIDEANLVESGEPFYIRVEDKDLRVLMRMGGDLDVTVTTSGGDKEIVRLEPFDAEGEYYFGSIDMELGEPVMNDGVLQVKGGEKISVEYIDSQTREGQQDVVRVAHSKVVSTARAGFMDGAFREYVAGVFDGQTTFVQVRDFDKSVSSRPDTVQVSISSRYVPVPEGLADDVAATFVDPDAEEEIRDSLTLTLRETGPHTGLFTGEIMVVDAAGENEKTGGGGNILMAADGDDVKIEYLDEVHIESLDDPQMRTSRARFLTGQIQDVRIVHREVDEEALRARKNLLEARMYLRLAEIFESVGLLDRAAENADVGLEKVDDIIRRSLRVSLEQDKVEQAYQVKWELLLAKGDLQGAIRVSRELLALFPASSLVDAAFMQIARAKIEDDQALEALPILNGILSIDADSELKAEAQFMIAEIHEMRESQAAALNAYRTLAENYPRSPFAGQALNKVIDYYIESRDFNRCLEMLEIVFMDYPDADFLDSMLFRWGVVLARLNRSHEAIDKLDQLAFAYPQSAYAERGRELATRLRQRTR